jgi:ABC-2 type transport system permease protein
MRTFAKLTWVELKLFFREPLNLVFALAFPALVVIVLGAVFGNTPTVDEDEATVFRGIGPMDYYVPGYVGLAIAAVGLIGIPVHLASYRERGVLRRLRASGLPPWTLLAAQAVVTLVVAVLGTIVLVAIGVIGYDVHAPKSPAGVAVVFVGSVLSFAAIGVLLGAVMPNARAAQGLGLILFFVMMFLSGTDGPRELMGEGLRRTGDMLLLTHVVTAMQNPWIGFATDPVPLAVITGTLLAATALAVRFLRWD